jgi:hypothetical protein
MFQKLLISLAVIVAFALPANAEEKASKEKPGKSLLNLDLGAKKDGVGVKAKVDPTKKNPLDKLELQIGTGDKKKKADK